MNNEDFRIRFEHLKNRFNEMEPEVEITVRDSSVGVEGFVVIWNTGICKGGYFDRDGVGVGKGGTRIISNLKLSDVKRLAKAMAEKNAAAGLPLGGAKSGLSCDYNDPLYELKCRRFYKLVKDTKILAEDGGMFGGFGYDVGCKPPLNAIWACEETASLNSFTGKPLEMGGTNYDIEGIAGLGVAHAAETLLRKKKIDISKISYAIQGIGAMGSAVGYYFYPLSSNLKYISDPVINGTWIFKKSASQDMVNCLFEKNITKVMELLEKEAEHFSVDSNKLLYTEVDLLFPCAMEDTFTGSNASKVKAKFICEGANNPTTDDAHEIFHSNGTLVIPDIIANPGGIISAYIELTSNISPEENSRTKAKVNLAKEETKKRISFNTKKLISIMEHYAVRPDIAADFIAYENIFKDSP
jgi:glutamate dehydrogenase/leucine dehydrogenase